MYKCPKLNEKLASVVAQKNKEIELLEQEIIVLKESLVIEQDYLNEIDKQNKLISDKKQKTESCIMKLKEAQKFLAFKYTLKDVQLYTDSVKVLDSFSAYHITDWMNNLSFILNDLLKGLNLSIEFSIEKDFIKINNNGQELYYSQLSSGQKKFLGVIFKIGILLQEGVNSGILMFDEGLGDIDLINFYKLIDILKGLNFQCQLIYQNVDKSIPDVNYINIVRKDGESNVK